MPDPYAALDALIELGVTRILSSGHKPSALAGAANLAAYLRHVGGRLQVLPGGGITVVNVRELLQLTGANQVHASLSGSRRDLQRRQTQGFISARPPCRPKITYASPMGHWWQPSIQFCKDNCCIIPFMITARLWSSVNARCLLPMP